VVERSEYFARQETLAALAREHGYAGVVAWSRGGGGQDRYADVYYLTGFYTHQPFVPDLAPTTGADSDWRWRAAGHSAVVIPSDGPVTLVVDSAYLQDPQPVADEVAVSADLIRTVSGLLAATERGEGRRRRRPRFALLGGDALPARWARALEVYLEARLGGADIFEADELGWRLRRRKSPAEQTLLRAAGALGARAMDNAMAAAVPGAREADVAGAFIETLVRGGGALYDIVMSSGPFAHTLASSGGPAGTAPFRDRRLAPGDLLRIDAYGSLGGYLFDFARTRAIGRPPNEAQRELLAAAHDSVKAGLDLLAPGVRLSEVADRCEATLAASSYVRRRGLPDSTMGGAWGHGLGLSFEPPWIHADSEQTAEPGMCLAVERRIEAPGLGGAQYEDDVLVVEGGVELLTPAEECYFDDRPG
jgi:Xaa-Pro aminopeptidase